MACADATGVAGGAGEHLGESREGGLALLARRLEEVRSNVRRGCEKCGRNPEDVTLIGISKTRPASFIAAAVAAGLRDFGENYVQEAKVKAAEFPELNWHLVGHLQRNKVNAALSFVKAVHSLDSLELIKRVDKRCVELGTRVGGFIEVHLGGEDTKSGVEAEQLFSILEDLRADPPQSLCLEGLMAVPPPCVSADDNRPYFRRLRELLDEILARGYAFWRGRNLSMGMSGDYIVAIEEGATHIRVGTGIFGERIYQ